MAPSQKRLTRILLALAIIGSLVIGGLWWDSTRYDITWSKGEFIVVSRSSFSCVIRTPNPLTEGIKPGVHRATFDPSPFEDPSLLPLPEWSFSTPSAPYSFLVIPYYLIILTYLGTLFLAWLLLMNRLARREANKESHLIDLPH